jgi:signal transduction histidine kinase/CheY-like chemotaxis protein/ligand-binding sensor domain-containing protein
MNTPYFKSSIAFWGIMLFFLISAFHGHAQEGIQQRFFTSQNGLKISWVNSITKSPNNAITIVHSPKFSFATYDGVNFDYTISPSGILGKTYEDFSGNLWSIDEGNLDNVNFYSNDKWQDLEFEVGIPFMPTPGMGNKLLFIRDGALNEFDKVKQQTRIIKQAEESQIGRLIDMTTFQDGSVWITGEDGIAKYLVQPDDSKEQWIDFQVPKELGLYHFNKPFEGGNGELTFMSKSSKSKQNVLAGFNGKMWQKLYASQTDEVYSGWRGQDNSLWIIKGSLPPLNGPLRDWNLFHVQQGQETCVVKNRILNRVLNDIVVEPNGTFWLATGSGLALFSPTLWINQKTKGESNKRTKKIHEDLSGRLWFAMEDAFSLFSDDKWELHQSDPGVFTGDICSLKNGLIVVGTTDSGGLVLYNPTDKSSTITFPFGNEKIRFFNQDKNGNCFIILQGLNETSRLIRYDGERIEILEEDLKIKRLAPGECEVTDIIQTSSGDTWIVTYTDIIVYKKGIRKSFDLKEEFDWGVSRSVLELGNGNIWISGGKGILQYDGENWSLVQAPEFETARMMIISKDSSIWVASGTGVHRLVNGSWISNTNEDGLPDAVIFDILEDKQGKIWAATGSGTYCYMPENDTSAPETVVPPAINPHEAIPSGEVQFIFEGHDKWDYTEDDRLQYSYRFDENSWSPFGNKTIAKGVGLSAGPHVFEVRAIDRNGNIDPSPASWHFTVLLPWYLETYVIMLLILAVCLILWVVIAYVNKHRQVEKLVLVRTAELKKSKEKAEKSELELQSKNEEYEIINEELNQTNEDLFNAKEKAVESAKRANLQRNAISNITLTNIEHKNTLSEALNSLTKSVSEALGVQRVGIWLFSDDNSEMVITSLFDTKEKKHSFGTILKRDNYPIYFKTISKTGRLYANDVQNNPQAIEFKEGYLIPLGITSMLDAGIFVNGELKGVVCCENVGEKIEWHPSQELFTNTVASMVGQILIYMDLIKSKEKAEESDRLKSAFLANMSHEIRTPMNGILGFTELLEEPQLTGEDQKKYIAIIKKSGDRLLKTINDIINISRIESGELNVSFSNTNINDQMEEIYNFFKLAVEKKGIQFSFENSLSNEKSIIKTDQEKVNAILINLVNNAIKYTDIGSIKFGYNLKTDSEPVELVFYVMDTGIGISKNRQEAIFERFIQAEIQDKMARQGSGLGLSIAKSYVQILNGKIWIDSEEGKGSTFYFTLPYNSVKRELAEKDVSPGTKYEPQIDKLNILIAEDDESSNLLLQTIVKNISNELLYSKTGIETIELCRKHPDINLILMDIQMPQTNGYEATRQIRQFNKDVIIIAQTAFGLIGDREKALEAGCDDYISKPVKREELIQMIERLRKLEN